VPVLPHASVWWRAGLVSRRGPAARAPGRDFAPHRADPNAQAAQNRPVLNLKKNSKNIQKGTLAVRIHDLFCAWRDVLPWMVILKTAGA
jgi:hypothetical protein